MEPTVEVSDQGTRADVTRVRGMQLSGKAGEPEDRVPRSGEASDGSY